MSISADELRRMFAEGFGKRLLSIRNVVGYSTTPKKKIKNGIETDIDCIRVYVKRKVPKIELRAEDIIPEIISGIPTDVVEIGELRALAYTQRMRPCPPGYSIGEKSITAGTFGCVVKDNQSQERWILSNNHVLCLDEKTEALSRAGWKFWEEVKEDDELATRSDKGELEWQRPQKLHKQWYSGKLMRFSGKWLDLLVTPDHRLFARKTFRHSEPLSYKARHGEEYSFILASDGFERCSGRETTLEMTSSFEWNCIALTDFEVPRVKYGGYDRNVHEAFKISDWLKLLGWYLSEGSVAINPNGEYMVSIRNRDRRHLEEVHRIFKDNGFNPFICKDGAVVVNSKQLYSYFKQFGHCDEKFIPQYVKEAPPEQIREFLLAYIAGDGCIDRHANIGIITKSKRMAGDLQELFLKVGMNSNIKTKKGSPWNPNGIYYEVRAHNRRKFRVMKKPKLEDYAGFVYCATVPNGTLLVRRNGKAVWTGNSAENKAPIGSEILQPGAYDGGTVANDTIAKLARFVTVNIGGASGCTLSRAVVGILSGLSIAFGRKTRFRAVVEQLSNDVDCAAARPINQADILLEVKDIGKPSGTAEAQVGVECHKTGRCFAKDTLILTNPEGPKTVDELEVGDKVICYNEAEGKVEAHPIVDIISQGIRDVYRIKTRNKMVEVTDNHPFLVAENKGRTKKPVSFHLDNGEIVQHKSFNDWALRWKELGELRRGDIIVTLHHFDGYEGGEIDEECARPKGLRISKSGLYQSIRLPEELQFESVMGIQKIGPKETYDIEVEGSHNFIGNGILLHNTTMHTHLKVTDVDFTGNVQYSSGVALFVDQIVAQGIGGAGSSGGDSGSAVFLASGDGTTLTGLLFAGSDTQNITIINKIQNVFRELGVSLAT